MFSDLAFLMMLDIGRLDVKFRCIILYTVPPGEFGNKVLNIGLFLLWFCFIFYSSYVGLLTSFPEGCCVLVVTVWYVNILLVVSSRRWIFTRTWVRILPNSSSWNPCLEVKFSKTLQSCCLAVQVWRYLWSITSYILASEFPGCLKICDWMCLYMLQS